MHHNRYLIAAIAALGALAAGTAVAAFRFMTRDVPPHDLPLAAWLLLVAKAVLLYPLWRGYNHLAHVHRDSWLAKTAEAAFIGFAAGDMLVLAALAPKLPWEVMVLIGVAVLWVTLRVLLQLAGDLFGPAAGMGVFLVGFVLAGIGTMFGNARFVLMALLSLAGLLFLGLTLCFYWRLVELRRYLGPFSIVVGLLGLLQIGVLFFDYYRPDDVAKLVPELTAAVAPALWFSHAALMFVLHRRSASAAHHH